MAGKDDMEEIRHLIRSKTAKLFKMERSINCLSKGLCHALKKTLKTSLKNNFKVNSIWFDQRVNRDIFNSNWEGGTTLQCGGGSILPLSVCPCKEPWQGCSSTFWKPWSRPPSHHPPRTTTTTRWSSLLPSSDKPGDSRRNSPILKQNNIETHVIPSFQRYSWYLCLIKYELDIHVLDSFNCSFSFAVS